MSVGATSEPSSEADLASTLDRYQGAARERIAQCLNTISSCERGDELRADLLPIFRDRASVLQWADSRLNVTAIATCIEQLAMLGVEPQFLSSAADRLTTCTAQQYLAFMNQVDRIVRNSNRTLLPWKWWRHSKRRSARNRVIAALERADQEWVKEQSSYRYYTVGPYS